MLKRLNLLKKHKLDLTNGIPTYFFTSNGQQEINENYLDDIFDELETPAVIKLYSFNIKPVSFKVFTRKPKY